MMKWLAQLFTTKTGKNAVKSSKAINRNVSNAGIVGLLKSDYGINLGSVFKLNKVLEKMGIIEKTGNGWLLTEMGRIKFTDWNSKIFRPDLWHRGIVKAVADFIKDNNIDVERINRKW